MKAVSTVQYIHYLWEKLKVLDCFAKENRLKMQSKQEKVHNKGAHAREFHLWDWVLLLLLSSKSKLRAIWQGTLQGTMAGWPCRLISVNRGRKRIHRYISLIYWRTGRDCLIMPFLPEPERGPQVPIALEPEEVPMRHVYWWSSNGGACPELCKGFLNGTQPCIVRIHYTETELGEKGTQQLQNSIETHVGDDT